MKHLLRDDVKPLDEAGLAYLEERIQAYEAEGLPESTYIGGRLRSMPPRWALQLLTMREHARKNSRRWQADDSVAFRGEHSPGLHEEALERVAPDVRDPKRGRGEGPFKCIQCGGTRWMRMVNHSSKPAEIETENARITHSYEQDESYLVPCDKCSPRRCLEYRTRKPIGGKSDEAPDHRKQRKYEREED